MSRTGMMRPQQNHNPGAVEQPTTSALDVVAVTPRVVIFRSPWLLATHRECHRNNVDQLSLFFEAFAQKHAEEDVRKGVVGRTSSSCCGSSSSSSSSSSAGSISRTRTRDADHNSPADSVAPVKGSYQIFDLNGNENLRDFLQSKFNSRLVSFTSPVGAATSSSYATGQPSGTTSSAAGGAGEAGSRNSATQLHDRIDLQQEQLSIASRATGSSTTRSTANGPGPPALELVLEFALALKWWLSVDRKNVAFVHFKDSSYYNLLYLLAISFAASTATGRSEGGSLMLQPEGLAETSKEKDSDSGSVDGKLKNAVELCGSRSSSSSDAVSASTSTVISARDNSCPPPPFRSPEVLQGIGLVSTPNFTRSNSGNKLAESTSRASANYDGRGVAGDVQARRASRMATAEESAHTLFQGEVGSACDSTGNNFCKKLVVPLAGPFASSRGAQASNSQHRGEVESGNLCASATSSRAADEGVVHLMLVDIAAPAERACSLAAPLRKYNHSSGAGSDRAKVAFGQEPQFRSWKEILDTLLTTAPGKQQGTTNDEKIPTSNTSGISAVAPLRNSSSANVISPSKTGPTGSSVSSVVKMLLFSSSSSSTSGGTTSGPGSSSSSSSSSMMMPASCVRYLTYVQELLRTWPREMGRICDLRPVRDETADAARKAAADQELALDARKQPSLIASSSSEENLRVAAVEDPGGSDLSTCEPSSGMVSSGGSTFSDTTASRKMKASEASNGVRNGSIDGVDVGGKPASLADAETQKPKIRTRKYRLRRIKVSHPPAPPLPPHQHNFAPPSAGPVYHDTANSRPPLALGTHHRMKLTFKIFHFNHEFPTETASDLIATEQHHLQQTATSPELSTSSTSEESNTNSKPHPSNSSNAPSIASTHSRWSELERQPMWQPSARQKGPIRATCASLSRSPNLVRAVGGGGVSGNGLATAEQQDDTLSASELRRLAGAGGSCTPKTSGSCYDSASALASPALYNPYSTTSTTSRTHSLPGPHSMAGSTLAPPPPCASAAASQRYRSTSRPPQLPPQIGSSQMMLSQQDGLSASELRRLHSEAAKTPKSYAGGGGGGGFLTSASLGLNLQLGGAATVRTASGSSTSRTPVKQTGTGASGTSSTTSTLSFLQSAVAHCIQKTPIINCGQNSKANQYGGSANLRSPSAHSAMLEEQHISYTQARDRFEQMAQHNKSPFLSKNQVSIVEYQNQFNWKTGGKFKEVMTLFDDENDARVDHQHGHLLSYGSSSCSTTRNNDSSTTVYCKAVSYEDYTEFHFAEEVLLEGNVCITCYQHVDHTSSNLLPLWHYFFHTNFLPDLVASCALADTSGRSSNDDASVTNMLNLALRREDVDHVLADKNHANNLHAVCSFQALDPEDEVDPKWLASASTQQHHLQLRDVVSSSEQQQSAIAGRSNSKTFTSIENGVLQMKTTVGVIQNGIARVEVVPVSASSTSSTSNGIKRSTSRSSSAKNSPATETALPSPVSSSPARVHKGSSMNTRRENTIHHLLFPTIPNLEKTHLLFRKRHHCAPSMKELRLLLADRELFAGSKVQQVQNLEAKEKAEILKLALQMCSNDLEKALEVLETVFSLNTNPFVKKLAAKREVAAQRAAARKLLREKLSSSGGAKVEAETTTSPGRRCGAMHSPHDRTHSGEITGSSTARIEAGKTTSLHRTRSAAPVPSRLSESESTSLGARPSRLAVTPNLEKRDAAGVLPGCEIREQERQADKNDQSASVSTSSTVEQAKAKFLPGSRILGDRPPRPPPVASKSVLGAASTVTQAVERELSPPERATLSGPASAVVAVTGGVARDHAGRDDLPFSEITATSQTQVIVGTSPSSSSRVVPPELVPPEEVLSSSSRRTLEQQPRPQGALGGRSATEADLLTPALSSRQGSPVHVKEPPDKGASDPVVSGAGTQPLQPERSPPQTTTGTSSSTMKSKLLVHSSPKLDALRNQLYVPRPPPPRQKSADAGTSGLQFLPGSPPRSPGLSTRPAGTVRAGVLPAKTDGVLQGQHGQVSRLRDVVGHQTQTPQLHPTGGANSERTPTVSASSARSMYQRKSLPAAPLPPPHALLSPAKSVSGQHQFAGGTYAKEHESWCLTSEKIGGAYQSSRPPERVATSDDHEARTSAAGGTHRVEENVGQASGQGSFEGRRVDSSRIQDSLELPGTRLQAPLGRHQTDHREKLHASSCTTETSAGLTAVVHRDHPVAPEQVLASGSASSSRVLGAAAGEEPEQLVLVPATVHVQSSHPPQQSPTSSASTQPGAPSMTKRPPLPPSGSPVSNQGAGRQPPQPDQRVVLLPANGQQQPPLAMQDDRGEPVSASGVALVNSSTGTCFPNSKPPVEQLHQHTQPHVSITSSSTRTTSCSIASVSSILDSLDPNAVDDDPLLALVQTSGSQSRKSSLQDHVDLPPDRNVLRNQDETARQPVPVDSDGGTSGAVVASGPPAFTASTSAAFDALSQPLVLKSRSPSGSPGATPLQQDGHLNQQHLKKAGTNSPSSVLPFSQSRLSSPAAAVNPSITSPPSTSPTSCTGGQTVSVPEGFKIALVPVAQATASKEPSLVGDAGKGDLAASAKAAMAEDDEHVGGSAKGKSGQEKGLGGKENLQLGGKKGKPPSAPPAKGGTSKETSSKGASSKPAPPAKGKPEPPGKGAKPAPPAKGGKKGAPACPPTGAGGAKGASKGAGKKGNNSTAAGKNSATAAKKRPGFLPLGKQLFWTDTSHEATGKHTIWEARISADLKAQLFDDVEESDSDASSNTTEDDEDRNEGTAMLLDKTNKPLSSASRLSCESTSRTSSCTEAGAPDGEKIDGAQRESTISRSGGTTANAIVLDQGLHRPDDGESGVLERKNSGLDALSVGDNDPDFVPSDKEITDASSTTTASTRHPAENTAPDASLSQKRKNLDKKLANRERHDLKSIGSFAAELQKKYGFRVRKSKNSKNDSSDDEGTASGRKGGAGKNGQNGGGGKGADGNGKGANKKGKKHEEQAILSRDRHLQISVCLARLPPKDRILADLQACTYLHRIREQPIVEELRERYFATAAEKSVQEMLDAGSPANNFGGGGIDEQRDPFLALPSDVVVKEGGEDALEMLEEKSYIEGARSSTVVAARPATAANVGAADLVQLQEGPGADTERAALELELQDNTSKKLRPLSFFVRYDQDELENYKRLFPTDEEIKKINLVQSPEQLHPIEQFVIQLKKTVPRPIERIRLMQFQLETSLCCNTDYAGHAFLLQQRRKLFFSPGSSTLPGPLEAMLFSSDRFMPLQLQGKHAPLVLAVLYGGSCSGAGRAERQTPTARRSAPGAMVDAAALARMTVATTLPEPVPSITASAVTTISEFIQANSDEWHSVTHASSPGVEDEAANFSWFLQAEFGNLGPKAAGVTGHARAVMPLENLPPELFLASSSTSSAGASSSNAQLYRGGLGSNQQKDQYQDTVLKELLAIEAAVYECLHSKALQTLLTMVLLLGNYVNYGVDIVAHSTGAAASGPSSSSSSSSSATEEKDKQASAAAENNLDGSGDSCQKQPSETSEGAETAANAENDGSKTPSSSAKGDLDDLLHTKSFAIGSLKKLREMKIQGQKGEVDMLTFLVHRLPPDLNEQLKSELHYVLAVSNSIDFADVREKLKLFNDNLNFATREIAKAPTAVIPAGVPVAVQVQQSSATGGKKDEDSVPATNTNESAPPRPLYSAACIDDIKDSIQRGEQRRILLQALFGYTDLLGRYLVRYFAEDKNKETCETFFKNLGSFLRDFDAAAKKSRKEREKRPKTSSAAFSRREARRGTR
ncbi:unnamed protein product [Amoebophrya sp. A120]|nr:unnamed protein product [Amoebophrya sp. A120]|eukprot:GSA120T00007728001.1